MPRPVLWWPELLNSNLSFAPSNSRIRGCLVFSDRLALGFSQTLYFVGTVFRQTDRVSASNVAALWP